MASSLKYAVPVLDLCDDAQSKCLWKHVWMIYGKLTEKNMSMKKIRVVNESQSSDPIAVGGPTNIVDKMHMHKCIRQTFIELIQEKNLQIKQLTNILIEVEELKTISSKFSEYEVAIYINKEVENSIWIVGPTIMIDAVVKCIEDKLHIFRVSINTNVKFDELKSLREKKEAHSIVDLSEKDQVICVFNNALKEDLFSVPSRYFSRDDAKQKLAKLEDNRKGTLSIKQGNDCATVQVSKTADAGFCPTQIEYLYKSKRVFFTKKQRKMAKMFLDKRKSFIENQFSVNIYEQDELFYEWIVKGEESMVEAAYKELLQIRHLPEQEKTYLIDDQIENIQLRLNTIAANSSCCVSLSSNTVILHELQTVAVDLREQIRCHRITIGGGFTVKLYKCSLPKNHWLGHNTLIVNVVHSAGDYTSKIKITANLNQSDRAALCLPIWKIYKEKDFLRKLMSEMKDYFKSAKLFPISIDLSEIEKVNWPVSQFLGTILLSFNFCEPTYCQFFVQSDDKFELSSDIINQWCQFKEGPMKKTLQINVVKSELAVMKVSSCDEDINECWRYLAVYLD